MGVGVHTVGEAACLLPITEGLCVKSVCQPRIGGRWCKTAQALIPAFMSLLGTLQGPDLESEACRDPKGWVLDSA